MIDPTLVNFDTAVADMMRTWVQGTGINIDTRDGAELLTVFEAVGFQLAQTSSKFDDNLTKAIPEAFTVAFGIAANAAENASTPTVRFSRSTPAPDDYLIAEGTRVQTPGKVVFRTTEAKTLLAGQVQADLGARAILPGISGNVPANTITELVDLIPGIERVTNIAPATGGRNADTTQSLTTRAQAFAAKLMTGRGEQMRQTALEVTASDNSKAQTVLVVDAASDNAIPSATVRVYVHHPSGVSSLLLDAIKAALEPTRTPGTVIEVLAVNSVAAAFTLSVRSNDAGAGQRSKDSIQAFSDALAIGEDVNLTRLIGYILKQDSAVYSAAVSIPAADVVISPYARAVLSVTNVLVLPGGAA